MRKSLRALCATLALTAIPVRADQPSWTLFNEREGGIPEPNATYYRKLVRLSEVQAGGRIRLEIPCAKSDYMAVNVYDEKGATLAFMTDYQITGQNDRTKPACKPGETMRLDLVHAPSQGSRPRGAPRELTVEGLDNQEDQIEIWVRAYTSPDSTQPKISLLGSDGKDMGEPAAMPVFEFPTRISLAEAKAKQITTSPGPKNNKIVTVPTKGSGLYPYGYNYLIARLDNDIKSLVPKRRFSGGADGQFLVVKFKPPTVQSQVPEGQEGQVRYWSLSIADGPSTQLLRDEADAAACLNYKSAKVGDDGNVTVIIGSDRVVELARAKGLNALPAYYPKHFSMPMLIFRTIPNDPDFKNKIPDNEAWSPDAIARLNPTPEERDALGLAMAERTAKAMGEYALEGTYLPLREIQATLDALSNGAPAQRPSSSKKALLPAAPKLLDGIPAALQQEGWTGAKN